MTAPLVCLLSAAHPPDDVRVVRKEGAALAAAGWRVVHVAPEARGVVAPEARGVVAPEARGVVAPEARGVVAPEARGSSKPEARGSSKPEARGSSKPEARGGSKPEARGSSKPEARGGSKPEARGSSRPEARGNSKPEARGSSKPEARGSSAPAACGPFAPAAGDAAGVVDGVALAPYARRGGRLRGLPALVRRARATRAAVLHASEPDAWVAALLAAVGRRTRVVLDVHEHYPSRLDARLPAALRPVARLALRLFCRAAASGADAVVVAKDGLDRDFAAPAKTVAVRNYAPALPVTPRTHAPGPLTLAHVGALGVGRGWPQMLAALAQAPPGTRLRLIGRFTDGSEAAFHAAACAADLASRIETTGWLPQPAALARLAECDVGLVLFQPGARNHDLALPHKLFDCMLAGLPVIAPHFATEVAAVVREAGCGELVDTADPSAIAAAVGRLADPTRRAALGAAGRAAALGRFGWGGEAARLVALYDRLAPRGTRDR